MLTAQQLDFIQDQVPDILPFVDLAVTVGDHIMGLKSNCSVDYKDDNSPVTTADKEANEIITTHLHQITPSITVVSEENEVDVSNEGLCWSVDPLDGTSQFIEGHKGFSVNIGLVFDGTPIMGIVACPAHGSVYYAGLDGKAYKQTGDDPAIQIHSRKNVDPSKLRVGFNTFCSPIEKYQRVTETLAERFNLHFPEQPIDINNIIPQLLVADGADENALDAYVKTGSKQRPLNRAGGFNWDNDAIRAIVRAAGGGVTDAYNWHNGLNNPADRTKRQHAYITWADRQMRDRTFPEGAPTLH